MIKDMQQWHELATMADRAEETLQSLRYGNHWLLRLKIKSIFGVDVAGREEAIKFVRKMCDEYIIASEAE